jgi:CRP-like cAMP-binding protein
MPVKHKYRKGEIIFLEGSQGETAYIIESGRVEISDWGEGHKRVLGVLRENDIFGEMGLIDGLPRSATAMALEDSEVYVLDRETFNSLAKQNPEIIMPIFKVLSLRLRETMKQLKQGYKLPGIVDRRSD